MAGVQIDTFSTSDVNLTSIMDTVDALRFGAFKLTLTNMDTTDEPEIASGSLVDVNGAYYEFTADTEITGTAADGVLYVKIVPSSTIATAQYTSTAPTWDSDKAGWYGTSTSANHRYVAKMFKDGTSYASKVLYDTGRDEVYIKEYQYQSLVDVAWIANSEKTLTFTFTSDVKAIFDINYNSYGMNASNFNLQYYIYIKDISITNNTVVLTFYGGVTAAHNYLSCSVGAFLK